MTQPFFALFIKCLTKSDKHNKIIIQLKKFPLIEWKQALIRNRAQLAQGEGGRFQLSDESDSKSMLSQLFSLY